MPILDHFLAIRTWVLKKWHLTGSTPSNVFRVFVSSTRGIQSLLVLVKSIYNVKELLLVTKKPHTMHDKLLR